MLDGSGSVDCDGTIVSYQWTKVSGPEIYTIEKSGAVQSNVNGLVAGTYTFRLTITDDKGARSTDDIQLTVLPATNLRPVANAGSDSTIYFPVRSVVISGQASYDPDGQIKSYAWGQHSGPTTALIENATNPVTLVSNLVPGEYQFTLTVTDTRNARHTDTVKIIVNTNLRYEESLSLGPNPAQHQVTLTLSGEETGTVAVRILNLNGVHERSFTFNKQEPVITKTIDISFLSKGVYIIEVMQAQQKRKVFKLIKL